MGSQYRVTLTKDERDALENICTKGKQQASRTTLLARALLLVDKGEFNPCKPWTLELVSQAVGMSERTLNHLKKRFVEEGLDSALNRKLQDPSTRRVKFDGKIQAQLTALACGTPPSGRARWTVRLLADKMVELKHVDSMSPMAVQRILKKTGLSLI